VTGKNAGDAPNAAYLGILHKLWGGPPGPRGSPWTRCLHSQISPMRSARGRRGRSPEGTPADRGVRPTINAERPIVDYVALGNLAPGSPLGAPSGGFYGPRAGFRARQTPAESRRQPGLATPLFVQDSRETQSKRHLAKPPAPPPRINSLRLWYYSSSISFLLEKVFFKRQGPPLADSGFRLLICDSQSSPLFSTSANTGKMRSRTYKGTWPESQIVQSGPTGGAAEFWLLAPSIWLRLCRFCGAGIHPAGTSADRGP